MSKKGSFNRRTFIKNSTALLASSSFLGEAASAKSLRDAGSQPQDIQMGAHVDVLKTVWILLEPGAGFMEKLAAKELARGLRNLGMAHEPRLASKQGAEVGKGEIAFTLSTQRGNFRHAEAYEITQESSAPGSSRVRMAGASPQAVLYSVFDFLERQGAFFGLDGEVYPMDRVNSLRLPQPGQSWRAQPKFATRGLLPFPDFLNCISVYNREEYRAALEAMARMRFNTLFTYCHTSGNQPGRRWNVEPWLSFEYGGIGHAAFLETTATQGHRWGYLPQRTSRFGMGSPNLYAGEVFGSEAATEARNMWEDHEFAQKLWREAFRYAHQLGIRVVVGFEVYSIPEEIVYALPPQARLAKKSSRYPLPPLDPESEASKDIIETRLGRLLEAYPEVDYVSLWQDEATNFYTRKGSMPFSLTPFKQAHAFLRRHAPKVRLVVSGWGGVVRDFQRMHKELAEDVIFSALNDSVGWDPVSEEFGKLGTRERWPIPWLEDDPSMWFPQFHVYRWKQDMDLAEQYGCQGAVGIHWRKRILNANGGFFARYSWEKSLQPEDYFESFAASLARPARARKLGAILNETDRDALLLSSFAGRTPAGFAQFREYSGDYDQGFQYWDGYDVPNNVLSSQAKVARELRELTRGASSAAEYERLNYLARQVEFLVPYSESWNLAFQLQQIFEKAQKLKESGQSEAAERVVREEGVSLWLQLAPKVREAILDFQSVVTTWNDLGTLASIHNKYERVALFRLVASMKEYLHVLPSEIQEAAEKARRPDHEARPRVFIPTRPTMLRRGERVRILAVVQGGGKVVPPVLSTRLSDENQWRRNPMQHRGRRTFVGELVAPANGGMFLDYYVSAATGTPTGTHRVTSPLEAPGRFYTLTLVV